MDYTTTHMPQLKIVFKRIFVVIKEGELSMLLNYKLNNKSQKMLWTEAIHTCERVRKSMYNTGSTKSPFGNFYG